MRINDIADTVSAYENKLCERIGINCVNVLEGRKKLESKMILNYGQKKGKRNVEDQ
jgi:hypothetical protein